MSQTLTKEESQELIKLCQAGRLFEIKNWIDGGRSLQLAPEVKKTILSVAVKRGFHSLVETIAAHETQEAKNNALADAVREKRLDLVELLVAFGAHIESVPFIDVLLCWDPHIIRFFIDNGTDVISGSPFAVAFGEKIRTALRPFLECTRRYPHLAIELQEQVDCALRKFASDGDLKWVNLMLWAGANARSRGPEVGEQYANISRDEETKYHTTALEHACYQENLEIVKRLKPDPKRDNLSELLNCSAALARLEIINTCSNWVRNRMIKQMALRPPWIHVSNTYLFKIFMHS